MNYDLTTRSRYLNKLMNNNHNGLLQDSPVRLYGCIFRQQLETTGLNSKQKHFRCNPFCTQTDDIINENREFRYPIFLPKNGQSNNCILLLHGLNERSWEKYGVWAEQLAYLTGKPVILFPIAFHINRTPIDWINPRILLPYVKERMTSCGNPKNLTFVNLLLSERLSSNPERFYTSGRETCDNIRQLALEIKNGQHPFLTKDTHIDFFSYSIGTLLAQTLLIANPDELFSDSKMVSFCGGSLFNQMNGDSRYIMDEYAFQSIYHYYTHNFIHNNHSDDSYTRAFKQMLVENYQRQQREAFFENNSKRFRFFSLKKDSVMPTAGILSALGKKASQECLTVLDFPFNYSHETPFPADKKVNQEVNATFGNFFEVAATYLS